MAVELGTRRAQAIREKWRHEMPSLAPGAGGQPVGDDVHLLEGTYETPKHVGVCPALTAWMGETVGSRSSC